MSLATRFGSLPLAKAELAKAKDALLKYEVEQTLESVATAAVYGYAEGYYGENEMSFFADKNEDGSLKLDQQGEAINKGVPASLLIGGGLKLVQLFGGDYMGKAGDPRKQGAIQQHVGNVADSLLGIYAYKLAAGKGAKAKEEADKAKTKSAGEAYPAPFGTVSGAYSPTTEAEHAAYARATHGR